MRSGFQAGIAPRTFGFKRQRSDPAHCGAADNNRMGRWVLRACCKPSCRTPYHTIPAGSPLPLWAEASSGMAARATAINRVVVRFFMESSMEGVPLFTVIGLPLLFLRRTTHDSTENPDKKRILKKIIWQASRKDSRGCHRKFGSRGQADIAWAQLDQVVKHRIDVV